MSTSSENPSDVEVRSGTQQVAAPAGVGDFAGDAPPENLQEAFRGYIGRVRGGEVGALPAVLGLVLLLVIFNQVSPFFLEVDNLANLPSQGAAFVLFAMGLIFVLLIGEIDLSAGTAGGTCAALMAVALRDDGHVRDAVGGRIFAALLIAMALALAIAARAKLWPALIVIVAGIIVASDAPELEPAHRDLLRRLRGRDDRAADGRPRRLGPHPVLRGDARVAPRLAGHGAPADRAGRRHQPRAVRHHHRLHQQEPLAGGRMALRHGPDRHLLRLHARGDP